MISSSSCWPQRRMYHCSTVILLIQHALRLCYYFRSVFLFPTSVSAKPWYCKHHTNNNNNKGRRKKKETEETAMNTQHVATMNHKQFAIQFLLSSFLWRTAALMINNEHTQNQMNAIFFFFIKKLKDYINAQLINFSYFACNNCCYDHNVAKQLLMYEHMLCMVVD